MLLLQRYEFVTQIMIIVYYNVYWTLLNNGKENIIKVNSILHTHTQDYLLLFLRDLKII